MGIADRLRYLEKKVNGALNWVRRPHVWYEDQVKCKNQTILGDFMVCWDYFYEKVKIKKQPCIIYDFGIREQPEYGEYLAKEFGCEVHAFDPSPITLAWIDKSGLRSIPNYHFHPYGAGGEDGNAHLLEYNWGQVSIIEYGYYFPRKPKNDDEYPPKGVYAGQRQYKLPVKTLRTVMKELKHTSIDFLKLDIEGSEYLFLEDIFDTIGCPQVDQLHLEWHHFSMDSRYGTPPHINVIINFLNDCGLKQFWTRTYWAAPTEVDSKKSVIFFTYNLASFMREKPLNN